MAVGGAPPANVDIPYVWAWAVQQPMMARATSDGSVFTRRMRANFRPNKPAQQPLKNSWSRIVGDAI